jgi:hypothetical protein
MWLQEEFLHYLDDWEQSVKERDGFSTGDKNKMQLSPETILGLKITGVTAFLSNRLCQDPLENVFGQQRQRGRVNENPNSRDFLKNTQALRVVNGVCRNVKGNC